MSKRSRTSLWRVIDWRVVAAAGVPVWAAAIGFVVWDKARHSARPGAPIALSAPPPVRELAPPAKPREVAARQELAPPQVVVLPIVIPEPAAPAPTAPRAFWLRDDSTEEGLPAAGEPEEAAQAQEPASNCQRFGTAVRFVKSPLDAMRQAREEDKLVFVLHLAGNLEDPGFT